MTQQLPRPGARAARELEHITARAEAIKRRRQLSLRDRKRVGGQAVGRALHVLRSPRAVVRDLLGEQRVVHDYRASIAAASAKSRAVMPPAEWVESVMRSRR